MFDRVPIWTKLLEVPLELWTPRGLSVVVSVVGRPIYVDKATKEHKRLFFVCFCVEA